MEMASAETVVEEREGVQAADSEVAEAGAKVVVVMVAEVPEAARAEAERAEEEKAEAARAAAWAVARSRAQYF